MSDTAPIVPIRHLKSHEGETVRVRGWLYNRRSSKKMHFLQVRDGTGIVQGIVSKQDVGDELFERAGEPGQEASITVDGTVKLDERAPGGAELHVTAIEIVGASEDYPLGKKDHGPDFLLSHRHLWLRSRKPTATLRIRDTIVRAIRDSLHDEGYVNVDAPIFTPNACEGTSTLFGVEYFDEGQAYLTQSGQLYMEAACMALGKVYCFGPTFRAEKSKTRRHLTEFWMCEPEAAFATLDDVMALSETVLGAVVRRVLESNREDLAVLERDVEALERALPPYPRITYDEAADLLKEKTNFEWGNDFGAPDETALGDHFGRPVMVHRWPKEIKAFYMARDPEDERLVLGVDVIGPEDAGELIGGSVRATDLAFIDQQMDKHDLPKEAFQWYLDLRRYGSVPHGGFGLGLERTVTWICGLHHVREAAAFPRMMGRIHP
ncbi:MAG: asparagine--tRNA ligase [Planctomycetota bacterium]